MSEDQKITILKAHLELVIDQRDTYLAALRKVVKAVDVLTSVIDVKDIEAFGSNPLSAAMKLPGIISAVKSRKDELAPVLNPEFLAHLKSITQ